MPLQTYDTQINSVCQPFTFDSTSFDSPKKKRHALRTSRFLMTRLSDYPLNTTNWSRVMRED